MTQYYTGIACTCAACGQRWPLMTEKGPADKDSFWPIVLEAMHENRCPACDGDRWTGTMYFAAGPDKAIKAEEVP